MEKVQVQSNLCVVNSLSFVHRVDRVVTEQAGWVSFGQCYCFRLRNCGAICVRDVLKIKNL